MRMWWCKVFKLVLVWRHVSINIFRTSLLSRQFPYLLTYQQELHSCCVCYLWSWDHSFEHSLRHHIAFTNSTMPWLQLWVKNKRFLFHFLTCVQDKHISWAICVQFYSLCTDCVIEIQASLYYSLHVPLKAYWMVRLSGLQLATLQMASSVT